MRWAFLGVAMLGGVLVAVQAVINNRMRQSLDGDALATALLSFGVGLLCLGTALLARELGQPSLRGIAEGLPQAPWWAWLGGLCGAGYVLSIVLGVPRIGVAWTLGGVLVGQQLCALMVDSFGLSGLAPMAVDWRRVMGLTLVMTGVFLQQPR